MTDDEIEKLIRYVKSPKGQKEIKEALEKVDKEIKKLNEARKIDPKTLYEPMTIWQKGGKEWILKLSVISKGKSFLN